MITASLVKELREHTGVGIMECKKALEEANGNLEAAITIMRKAGQAKAAKKWNRIVKEGVTVVKISSDNRTAFMVEVNCETDFVSRDRSFLEFTDAIAIQGLKEKIFELDKFLAMILGHGQTVSETRDSLVAKIGENINIGRIKMLSIDGDGMIGSYVHNNGQIGVMVEISIVHHELAKDIAMHIAASKPIVILPDELPADLVAKEKDIYLAELQDAQKTPEILEKIVSGRVQKFINEMTLIKQPFVKNPNITVEDLLQQFKAQVCSFIRFEVGEGWEEKETNFAEEVQVKLDAKK